MRTEREGGGEDEKEGRLKREDEKEWGMRRQKRWNIHY